ncbi:MAG TPA: hypothetical protein PLI95_07435 [Polyangiaceae bacterium]|nr:hypothetical protein [Polyangiaceae bacterium]
MPKAALETSKMPVANPIERMHRPSNPIAIADTRCFSMGAAPLRRDEVAGVRRVAGIHGEGWVLLG